MLRFSELNLVSLRFGNCSLLLPSIVLNFLPFGTIEFLYFDRGFNVLPPLAIFLSVALICLIKILAFSFLYLVVGTFGVALVCKVASVVD